MNQRPPLRESTPFLQLVPNLVTILGLCAGLSSIRYVLDGRFEIAAALIIFAALLDGVDGLLARRLNAATNFGAELDSLSDFVNFGVAPGVLVFQYALADSPGLGWVFVLAYTCCACLRLARFNINRDAPNPGGRSHFVGVPAPAGASLALAPVYLGLADVVDLSQLPLVVALYLGLVGFLMISRLPTISPKGLRISKDKVIWVLIGMSIIAGLVFSQFWLLMVMIDFVYFVTLGFAALRLRSRSV
jgi:CDP-diacylglycerol--serine O-phosphatidyltransferase